jgi:hypothetical protein
MKGRWGRVISRALFQHQKIGTDALAADQLPYILNYSMRIRQLMAMKRTDLHLLRAGEPEDNVYICCADAHACIHASCMHAYVQVSCEACRAGSKASPHMYVGRKPTDT